MIVSASRLTMYAVLSALELDAKRVLVELSGDKSPLPDETWQKAEERAFNDGVGPHPVLSDIVPYLDLGDISQGLRRVSNAPKSVADFCTVIESLLAVRNRIMHSRPLKVGDFSTVMDQLPTVLHLTGIALPNLKDTEQRLKSDPGFVLSINLPVVADTAFHNLPTPDYDDTTLIGRDSDVSGVLRSLRGAYPVLSIIGEGGLGKTALALQSAYELLDAVDNPFKAIIWVTLKRQTFGPSGVSEVRDAISDAFSMISAINKELGEVDSASVTAIHDFMRAFPMLLILDNLETINTAEVHELFADIPIGSKILVTSRIGLREFETRRNLDPLSPAASTQLMRVQADILNVSALRNRKQEELAAYATRLYFNPLAIRWFVASVAGGAEPRAVTRNKDSLLAYCFENVHSHLSEDQLRVIDVLKVARRALSGAEISFVLEGYSIDFKAALNTLIATSIVRMNHGTDGTMTYGPSEFAADFLQRFHLLDDARARSISEKLREIELMQQEVVERRNQNVVDPGALSPTNRDERIAATYLIQALDQRNITKIEELITRAKNVAPDYADAYKIAGFIYAKRHMNDRAEQEFELALGLNPGNASSLTLYADFLLAAGKPEDALTMASKAAALSEASGIHLTYARALMYCGKHEEAIAECAATLKDLDGNVAREIRIAGMTCQEAWRRIAEHEFRGRDPRALTSLLSGLAATQRLEACGFADAEMAFAAFRQMSSILWLLDDQNIPAAVEGAVEQLLMSGWFFEMLPAIRVYGLLRCCRSICDVHNPALVEKITPLVNSWQTRSMLFAERFMGDCLSGTLVRVIPRDFGGYGFIEGQEGPNIYFTAAEVWNAMSYELEEGDRVFYRLRPGGHDVASEILVERFLPYQK